MRKFNLRNLLIAVAMVAASSFTGCNTEEVDYDTPYLKLSESSKTFDHSQSSYVFTVESNRPWKITTEKDAQGVVPDWLRAQPDHGDGNGQFTVTVLSLEGIERLATLRVSTATVWEALRITQTGTIETTKLFFMNFGTGSPSQQPSGGWPTVSTYTDWGASGAGMTDATSFTGDCTLRGNSVSEGYSDASGGTNAYLGWDKYFQISNISVSGGNQLNISFGSAFYDGSSDNVFKTEYITVEVSTDGGSNWLPMSYTTAPTSSDRWYFSSGSVVIPTDATKFDLRFKGALSSGQLRIDDVSIVAQEAQEPQVVTGQASDITSTSATLNGTYNFGTPATELGFEWKLSSDGSEAYQKVQGVGSVAFTAPISGLSASTSYDYRAYAILDGETYYGDVKSFTSDAGGTVLLKESMGTEGGSSTTYVDSYTGWLKEGLGAYDVTYTGVASDKVTIRATSDGASKDYEGASGSNYVYFGKTQPNSFFVNNITTGGASNFTLSFGCNEYSSSQDNIVTAAELQVFYSTTGADNSYTQLNVPYSGVERKWQLASVSFTTPAPAQNLWLKFTCNVNSAISIDDITLRTTDNVNIEPAPKVTTASATNVGDNTATVGGSYTYTGSQTISKVGVAYKTASDTDFTEMDAASVASPFTVDLTGLANGTIYNYKAYVKIGSDTYYGNEESFTTTGAAVAKSIKELKALMTGTADYTVAENITITGTVVSNYQTANMDYMSIVLQDSQEPGSGITVRWPGSSGHEFAYGAELTVSAQGGELSYYYGVLQLTPTATDKITATGKTNTPQPVSVTVEQLNTDQYQGMYVAVPGSQVVAADLSKTMSEGASWGNIQMETTGSGSGTYIMSTKGGKYGATFKNESVPQLNGTLKGVAYINNTTIQVMPQALTDFQGWTDPRFGAPEEIAFGAAEFTATKGVANEALEGAYIEIPYTQASGNETYPNVVVTVTGAGIGTIPTSIPYNVSSVTAGAGTIRIPVTGTPAEGEVNFSVAGIGSDVITCSTTFVAAGDMPYLEQTFSMFADIKQEYPQAASTNYGSTNVEEPAALTADGLSDWSGAYVYAAKNMVKLGSSSKRSTIITPALSSISGTKDVTLTFDIAAWNKDATEIIVNIIGGGTVEGATSATVTGLPNDGSPLVTKTLVITGATSTTQIQFLAKQASGSRFFLTNITVK